MGDADKLNEKAKRRGHERVQDIAEREVLEELAAEAKAAAAKAKRKSTKQAAQEESTSQLEMFDVGEDMDIEAHMSDSWGIIGRDVSIPNVAWRGELDDGCVAVCRVVGLAPRVYVVSTGGFHYTFTVAHMRIYLQTTESAQLLQDLGGVAAIPIKGAPTTQAIGTRAKRKAVSRRASTLAMRLVLTSILLLGLACGGQTADPGGSEDPMDDDLKGRPPAPHGDAELLATLQEWAARDRAPVTASPGRRTCAPPRSLRCTTRHENQNHWKGTPPSGNAAFTNQPNPRRSHSREIVKDPPLPYTPRFSREKTRRITRQNTYCLLAAP